MGDKERSTSGKILAISDTHFGDDSQLLNRPELVDRLAEVLSRRGEIAELVLLGDILDVWMKPLTGALRDGKYFVEKITGLENIRKITFVPGNHDHQLFMDEFRNEMDQSIKKGNLSDPKFSTVRDYDGTTLSYVSTDPEERFRMVYPFIVREVNGKEVIFTHGHHLDYFDKNFWWARTFWLSRRIINKRKKKKQSVNLHDIEKANLPFYGAMSVNPWVPELIQTELRLYSILNFFGRLFRKKAKISPRRDTLIKENYDEIEKFLPLLNHQKPGCFVFGHTHRPGKGKITGSDIDVINTGSWVEVDEGIPNMTWAEIGKDTKLFRLCEEGPREMNGEEIEDDCWKDKSPG